jgi:hypothetical protein
MAKRVVILGKCDPVEDAKVLNAVAGFVSDTRPDEVICIDPSGSLIKQLRASYDGLIGAHESDRYAQARKHPGLVDVPAALVENLLDFDGVGVRLLPEFHKVCQGWITTAKVDCVAPSRIAGNTALNAARKFNTSVVLGHTGRMGIASHSYGYSGRIDKMLTGVEVGTLVDRKVARSFNGQQGFGLLTIDGDHVKPELAAIGKGEFTVDGRTSRL